MSNEVPAALFALRQGRPLKARLPGPGYDETGMRDPMRYVSGKSEKLYLLARQKARSPAGIHLMATKPKSLEKQGSPDFFQKLPEHHTRKKPGG